MAAAEATSDLTAAEHREQALPRVRAPRRCWWRSLISGPGCIMTPHTRLLIGSKRLLKPIGTIPPAEAEARYYAQANEGAMAA